MRLDKYVSTLAPSRNKAMEWISQGRVLVNGKPVYKKSLEIADTDVITVEETQDFVSRSGHKLEAAFQAFEFDVNGQTVLDIGASTGGFTQCVLDRGARKVYALDVGHLQLAPSLQNDSRIINMEGTNARQLEASWFEDPVDFVCMDVSFISSLLILEPLIQKMAPEHMCILIKPQFELDKKDLNKRGIVKSEKQRKKAIEKVESYIRQFYRDVRVMDSPVQGKEGNQEALLYASRKVND